MLKGVNPQTLKPSNPQTLMAKSLSIDPVTRIEGHLSVRVEVENGKVSEAFCSGEMFRGFEVIMRGRHPMDAQQITQRICGVCPIEHGVASAMAQDAAYGIRPPPNGTLLRNIVQGANFLASHLTHFYALSAVDFVDVTAILSYTGKDPGMNELRDWVKAQLASKVYLPAAPFLPRYDTKYLDDKEANLGLLKNYLEALNLRRLCHQMGALFSGKMPHMASIIPGGMSQTIDAQNISAAEGLLATIKGFILEKYVPDVVAVSSKFPEYWKMGRGPGNFLAYGVFPEENDRLFLPSGTLITGTLSPLDTSKISEDVAFSWFAEQPSAHPFKGETVPQPDKPKAYSWVKAPRYEGQPMEVGALARLLIAHASKHEPAQSAVASFLQKTGHTPADLISVMGRHASRAIEAGLLVDALGRWLQALRPENPCCVPFTIPKKGQGIGLTEAARGALGHWLQIDNAVVSRYQCVVPTTWNCSPKDNSGTRGPVETALVGTFIASEENPIEAVRVIRSFDPCLACAVH